MTSTRDEGHGISGDLPSSQGALRRALALGAGFVVAGALHGLSLRDPAYSACMWISLIMIAALCHHTHRVLGALAGMWVMGAVARYVSFPWLAHMNEATLGYQGYMKTVVALAESVVCALPVALCVTTGFALAKLARARSRFEVPMILWFPLAWGLGERLNLEVISLSIYDVLMTQWQAAPVLRMVGHLGWWPAFAVCMVACVGAAQALVTRRGAWLAALAPAALCALLLPPLPRVGHDALRGIAAVHVSDALTLPHQPPPGEAIDLVLWPEDARHLRPMLGEGITQNARIEPPWPGSDSEHLMGLMTLAPMAGDYNQLVHVGPGGEVRQSRAKRFFMPVAERTFLGFGGTNVARGESSTYMEVAGRRVVALICGELLSRDLAIEGVEDGGELLLVSARDHMMRGDVPLRQLLAIQVMRSVELGVPSARSSMGGWAYMIGSDGEVLAVSGRDHGGVLLWDKDAGARDHLFRDSRPASAPARPSIAVLYEAATPQLRTPCPEGMCAYYALDDFECPEHEGIDTVVVAGHGRPPAWLAHGPSEVARAVRCFEPSLLVVDTCLGASSELFEALGAPSEGLTIVAASTLIPAEGLRFGEAFFSPAPTPERARAVTLAHGSVLRWELDLEVLARVIREAEAMDEQAKGALTTLRNPPTAIVDLAGAGDVLIPWSKAASQTPRRRPAHRRSLK